MPRPMTTTVMRGGPAGGSCGRGAPRIAADGAGDHGKQAVAPLHLAADDEDEERDAVGHGGGDDLEGIDLVQVLKAEEREQGDDEESGAGAEVADVKADEDGGEEDAEAAGRWGPGAVRRGVAGGFAALKPAVDGAAGGEDGGRDQQQPGNQVEEGASAGVLSRTSAPAVPPMRPAMPMGQARRRWRRMSSR